MLPKNIRKERRTEKERERQTDRDRQTDIEITNKINNNHVTSLEGGAFFYRKYFDGFCTQGACFIYLKEYFRWIRQKLSCYEIRQAEKRQVNAFCMPVNF